MSHPETQNLSTLLQQPAKLPSGFQSEPISDFYLGADVSFLDEIETKNGRYFDADGEADCLYILKSYGINAIRLRVWNQPSAGFCDVERTLKMARRVKKLGMSLLLDFHYSDSWADPEKQYKPASWAHLSHAELVRAVRDFTHQTVARLCAQGTPPEVVQVGNEITYGMLWDDAKVYGPNAAAEKESAWDNLAELFLAGSEGVKSAHSEALVMLHTDRGGDNQGARFFLDNMIQHGVNFDVLGLSYYPWWHGPIEGLCDNLSDLATRYEKDLVLVETAYPWTDSEIVKSKEVEMTASPQEQAEFLATVIDIVKSVPYGRGKGVYYWEPDSIPTDGIVHGWHRMSLFDSAGHALPGLGAFSR